MTPVVFFLLLFPVMLIPSVSLSLSTLYGPRLETWHKKAHHTVFVTICHTVKSHLLKHGDIKPVSNRNAVPCTATGCKWPKTGSYVIVPVAISSDFDPQQLDTIVRALVGFHQSTCIRFVWLTNQANFLYFFSGTGCWSFLGRQSGGQAISLQKDGCVYFSSHVRSDRDSYVNVNMQNVQPGMESNFEKVQTNNLGTAYDFNSVMQYSNSAFSKNNQPTITAKSNPNLVLGGAAQMSPNDVARVNRLYQCCK
uniref:Metalloendopeptidase n=1 Tax=Anabas testudineus TaxID=64144 RepID=A0A3Q1J027_ANATE